MCNPPYGRRAGMTTLPSLMGKTPSLHVARCCGFSSSITPCMRSSSPLRGISSCGLVQRRLVPSPLRRGLRALREDSQRSGAASARMRRIAEAADSPAPPDSRPVRSAPVPRALPAHASGSSPLVRNEARDAPDLHKVQPLHERNATPGGRAARTCVLQSRGTATCSQNLRSPVVRKSPVLRGTP